MPPAPFIDYASLLLINAMIGYFVLAGYVARGLDDPDQQRWAIGFGIPGSILLLFGTAMVLTWPLPGPYGAVYGEMSVLFGALLLGAALCLARGWRLEILAACGFFAGVAAVITGLRFWSLHLTLEPLLSAIGFVLSGLAGIFAAPMLLYMRDSRPARAIATGLLVATGLIWAAVVYPEYWTHLGNSLWAHWTPR